MVSASSIRSCEAHAIRSRWRERAWHTVIVEGEVGVAGRARPGPLREGLLWRCDEAMSGGLTRFEDVRSFP